MGGGHGKREFFDVCPSFVSKPAKGGKGTYSTSKRMDMSHLLYSLEGWEKDSAGLYILLSLPLIGGKVGVIVSKANRRNLPQRRL